MFRDGEEWTVRGYPAGPTHVDLIFRTAYLAYGFDAKAPRWLFAEVTGPAESLEDAVRRFPNAVRSLTPIFDVALNASVDDLDLHIAFDGTPGCEERKFFQNFLREDPPTLRQTRPAHAGLLSHLTEAIARHPDHVRLHRASAHYQQALRFWSFGDETRAVGQLWMGMEALTQVAKRQEMSRTGATSPAELAQVLNVDLTALDGTLRRIVLFAGDEESYSDAKLVSDGFEHGFKPLDELRVLARDVRDASAAHLRKAIVVLSRVSEPASSEMLRSPYDTPIIGFPITKYLRGTIKGSGHPAAPDQRYPSVTWRSDITTFRLKDDGRYDVQWNENISPKLGPAVQLTDISIEMWSGDKNTEARATMQRASVQREGAVPRAKVVPDPGDQPLRRRSWGAFLRRAWQSVIGRRY